MEEIIVAKIKVFFFLMLLYLRIRLLYSRGKEVCHSTKDELDSWLLTGAKEMKFQLMLS
jgi:hypothetical protein